MVFACIERAMRLAFFNYGGFIARHPYPFLICPLLLTAILGPGLIFLTEEQDVEDLYTPVNGQGKTDRATVEELFAQNGDSDPLLSRITRYGNALLRMEDGGNILEESAIQEVLNLHEIIMDISIQHDSKKYGFFDLCSKVDGACNENGVLSVYKYNSSKVSEIALTYPLYKKDANSVVFLGGELGGVKFKSMSSDELQSAEALLLTYILLQEDEPNDLRAVHWEDVFIKVVSEFNSSKMIAERLVSTTIEDELNDASADIIRDFSITLGVFVTFTILSCMMFDWVRSKPWLAACGVLSACLALVSSFGLMCYVGVPYVNVVGAAPFLIIGIGVDDMFIMLAAWRKTSTRLTVEQRMREAFSEAAMSITITSVTDGLAFGIGTITVFKSVRIFCLYLGTAVLFDYLFQITFFGACMVLTGRREAANRHCLCCYKVKSKMEQNSIFIISRSGTPEQRGGPHVDSGHATRQPSSRIIPTSEHGVMVFFKRFYGPIITSWWMVLIVIVLYCGYLAIAIFGCTQIEMGLSLRNLARDDSYGANYLDDARFYFTSYGPQIALVFTEPKDSWHPSIQDIMEQTLVKMEETEYVHGKEENLSSSWLRAYLSFLKLNGLHEPTQTQFINTLRDSFLKHPAYQHYSMDIVFNKDNTSIDSSRFFVTTKDLDTTNKESSMMTTLREVANDAEIPAIVYNPNFIFFDQFIAIYPNTMQNLGIAIGAMFVVSLLMIPNPICSILVTLSLTSIVTGVVGFMAHWDVNLDNISMINLIICIGFSVDFSAHISYAYVSGNQGSRRENAIHALYSLGMPIVQGSLTTILGILILAFSETYIFRTFFKTMFLVITLGTLHGIVFIPVFLMLIIPAKEQNTDQFPDRENPVPIDIKRAATKIVPIWNPGFIAYPPTRGLDRR
ncbi:patched domain-containing protein 3-like isoform X1 [Asterias rubens]|uniref:patched domain-containing protein 3-like isoform X1 n=1 Tax=Asterias rubens TaxID=7604 RepID=UPI001454E687|nr:patched domain-containing protein 3-like isoform X1 [Asterias rubens]